MQSIKFNNTFFLTINDLKGSTETLKRPKAIPTNFIFVIDVSGSMSGDLSFIRKQLKNKLPSIIKAGDTVTIIWFSGRNEAGILKEEVEVKSLTNLQELNDAIDRFLKPIGLTAFHKPLVLAQESIKRIKKNRPDSLFSLIFLTDGGNNDCSWGDVTKTLKGLESDLAASTFVEYGYYADSKAISQMAELVGGERIQAPKFDDYDVVVEAKLSKTYSSAKKVLIDVPTDRKFDFAFTVSDDNEIILYSVKDNQVLVPESTKSVLVFTSKAHGQAINYSETNETLNKLMYGSVYALSDKLQNDYVDDVFRVLGDTALYKIFVNAFGKQKLMQFKAQVKECMGDTSKQFESGRSTNLVADENAYCVMNLIDDLTSDKDALIYPLHPDFEYNRIGAKKVVKKANLDEAKKKLVESVNSATTAEEIQEALDGFNEESLEDAKFQFADVMKGYSVDGLVWSSDRANLSIRVKFDGFIDVPANDFGIKKVDTFIYRTYTIIKDGVLNLTRLPVSLSDATISKLKANGVRVEFNSGYGNTGIPDIYVIDFAKVPTINKKMVKSISAKRLGLLEYELFETKAAQKVYGYFEDKLYPKKSSKFIAQYGVDGEAWLKSLGITEYNGFNPSMTTEKSGDFYMAPNLDIKIAKYSALPAVDAVLKKIEAGSKLNAVDQLIKVGLDEYNDVVTSKLYTTQKDEALQKQILENWLKTVQAASDRKRKALMQEIAQIKFSLILSQKWFEEFASLDEDTLNVKVGNNDLTIKFEMAEKQISL